MTSPVSVGTVSVEVVAEAAKLAKSLKAEVEKAFKGLDVGRAIKDSVGDTTVKLKADIDLDGLAEKIRQASASVKVPVEPDTDGLQEKVRKTRVPKVKVPLDPDTGDIPEKVKQTRVPKVSVPLDPLMQAFQQEVRRQTAALARQVNVNVPVDGDTTGLRTTLGAELAAIQAQTKIQVPTEPGDKATYEAKLKAQLAQVSARVKQTVKVDADVDKKGVAGLNSALRSLPTSGVGLLKSAFDTLSSAMAQSGSQVVQFGGSVVGALSTAAGPIGTVAAGFGILVGGIGAVAAAAAVAIPAISALAGAVAALPGILAGAGAGFGALSLGFKGISDAFKPKAGGGGGGGGGEDPASRARRIAGAERGVEAARRGIAGATRALQSANRNLEKAEQGVADAQARVADAQRRALQAQQAVNRARKEAKEDIEDLNRSLKGASLNEEDAALRVTEALRELNEAKEKGVLPDIQRADLEYRQAQQALEEAKDTTEDLGEAAADANKKGVEGSDKVQDALQDQVEANQAVKDAIRGVADAQVAVLEAQNGVLSANDALKSSYDGLASAQDALAEAQKKAAAAGGGGGGLKDIVKLAPEAQKFVNAIKALKPAFESLRLDVQNRLFKNLDDTVRQVGAAWLPALRTTLGSYADTFNQFFRNLGTSISQPKFITDLQAGAESSRQALADIGQSVTTSLVPAFGALSKAAGPFIETLGKEIADIVTEFSNWVLEGEKTGGLKSFFETASEALHDIFTTGKEVGKLIGNIFRILTNGNGKQDKSAIDSFNDGLKSINAYLADPANQAKIAKFVDDVKVFLRDLKDAAATAKRVLDGLFPSGDGSSSSANGFGTEIGKALVAGIISGIGAAAKASFASMGPLANFFAQGPFSLIGAIKALLGIKSPSTVTAELGGFLIDGLIQGIGDKFGALLAKVQELPGKIREGVGDAAKILTTAGRNVVAGLANGIVAQYGALKTRANGLKSTIVNVFSGAGAFLSNAGRNTAAGLANGIVAMYGSLRTRAAGLRTTITNALSNAGSWLVNAGRNTVIGLWNGIASLGGWLYNKVTNFVSSNVKAAFSRALNLGSPSRLTFAMGEFVSQGLALGIESEEARVAKAAQAIAAAALPDVGGIGFDVSGAADAAISRSLQVASANSLQASWAPGMTGDKILDALRGSIKFSHRGDVQAALGSG
ncbi:hypothetical protein ACQP2Y_21505 [Actinoplanes sp. CA-051413]|uniref:phage tail protein n=1 Tax=Actinoplanes sp. CA-051413 TaxID=3239899 RepID=UPI003D98C577